MKAWIKGGLWGLGSALFISAIISSFTDSIRFFWVFFITPALGLVYFVSQNIWGYTLTSRITTMHYTALLTISILISIIFWFFLGALIGLIISRVKSNKKKKRIDLMKFRGALK